MTRAEAITTEVGRYVAAARDHDQHLAHIRLAALRRLRGLGSVGGVHLADDCDGDAMFGDDHAHPLTDLPLAA